MNNEKKMMARFYDSKFIKDDDWYSESYISERLMFVKSHIADLSDNIRILEIGCGRAYCQHLVKNYIGVDISIEAGKKLKKPFICGDAESLPFANQSFDVVMSFCLLEHTFRPDLALNEMDRVLRKKGLLILDAAWRVTPWKPLGLDVNNFKNIAIKYKFIKNCLPILDFIWQKGIFRIPVRVLSELKYKLNLFNTMPYTAMKPNLEIYYSPDSDAAVSIDNHSCALYLISLGYKNNNLNNFINRVLMKSNPLIMEKL